MTFCENSVRRVASSWRIQKNLLYRRYTSTEKEQELYQKYYQIIFYYASVQILYDIDTANWYGD